MTFDEYFYKEFHREWTTLKMYDEQSPAVDIMDALIPTRTKNTAEKVWDDSRKAALLEAAEWFKPKHKYEEMNVGLVQEKLRRMAENN